MPIGLLKGGLIVTSIALFVATAMIYVSQSQQRALMTATIRSSGWVAYQADLEFVKTQSAFATAALVPSGESIDALLLRLEILRSRLPVLYASDEGRILREIVATEAIVKPFESQLDSLIDEVGRVAPSNADAAGRLRGLAERLRPLGQVLQKILKESVAYNQEIFRRERALEQAPGIVPLVLLFLSGATLAVILILQGRRDRVQLAQIVQGKAAIAAMEENLRAVIEATPACMVVVDPRDDSVSFMNGGAAALVSDARDDPAWPRFVRAAREAAAQGQGNRWGMLSMAYARGAGDVVSLRGSFCRVLWEHRPQHLLVLADTTQVRNAELKVMQAAKLATLGEMATALAHELNQPLAVIKMAVANARRHLSGLEGGEPVSAKLDRISAQVDRAKRITDQVRRYGRMPTEQLQPFALRPALELAIGFVAEQYRAAAIRLAIDIDLSNELAVRGEQTMFEQVIVNLLVNARDAFDNRSEAAHPVVRVTARQEGGRALIAVEDNAGGIAPDMLERLFEPFATTKPTEKGTGLGLSLARSVVRDMGGSIRAENAETGARFLVDLPISPSFAERNAA